MNNVHLKDEITVSFLTTKQDYANLKVDLAKLGITKAHRKLSIIIAVICATLSVSGAVFTKNNNITVWFSYICLLLLAFISLFYPDKIYPYLIYVSAQNEYEREQDKYDSQIVTLSSEKVTYQTNRMKGSYPWSVIYEYKITQHYLIIYFGICHFIALPLRTLTENEINQLKNL